MADRAAPTSRAIVLAAGAGRRLLPLTADRPKVLVEIGGEPIILRMLRQLGGIGVTDVTIVVGDRQHLVREAIHRARFQLSVEWIENPDYAATNNSWSLGLARAALAQGGFLIEGDVVADDSVLHSMSTALPETCWMVRRFTRGMEGAFLTADASGRLSALSIVRTPTTTHSSGWKSMGLLKLSGSYGKQLAGWLQREFDTGRRDRYYDLVIADHLDEAAPVLVQVDSGFWSEIDTPEDAALASRSLRAAG